MAKADNILPQLSAPNVEPNTALRRRVLSEIAAAVLGLVACLVAAS
jgi:hypothetical protein